MGQTFILTWNPDRWIWPDDEYESVVRQTAEGLEVQDNWSTGSRKGGVDLGDSIYLLRQHRQRGIVGRGTVEPGGVFQEEHWDPALAKQGRTSNYVTLWWQDLLRVDDRLPVELLKTVVPDVNWRNMQGSGVRVPDSGQANLDILWDYHLSLLDDGRLPEEAFTEGASTQITVNRYERNPEARRACLDHHGTTCAVCGFDFASRYGELGDGYIHVHHLKDLSSLGGSYQVDPIKDLRPVCPNCHAMLHRQRPALSIKELKQVLRSGSGQATG